MLSVLKKFCSLLLAVILLIPALAALPLSAKALSNDIESKAYDINEPYCYPVLRGSKEWLSMKTHAERVDACQIPESILSHMTTEALLETVLNYPLLIDLFLWRSIDEGMYSLRCSFNGMDELMRRTDLEDALSAMFPVYSRANLNAQAQGKSSTIVKSLSLAAISFSVNETALVAPSVVMSPSPVTVYTPAGTAITAIRDATYNLISDYTGSNIENHIAEFEEEIALSYPNIVKIADSDPKYNCHSYAWYGEGSASNIYILNPSAYMSDGSYTQYTTVYGPTMVCYRDSTLDGMYQYIHSAVINRNLVCYSKFGYFGLYRHTLEACPYYDQADSITYWRLNLDYAE